jgi:hypothetical protein
MTLPATLISPLLPIDFPYSFRARKFTPFVLETHLTIQMSCARSCALISCFAQLEILPELPRCDYHASLVTRHSQHIVTCRLVDCSNFLRGILRRSLARTYILTSPFPHLFRSYNTSHIKSSSIHCGVMSVPPATHGPVYSRAKVPQLMPHHRHHPVLW